MATAKNNPWQDICAVTDLVANAGICALLDGHQVAIFYLPAEQPSVYALGNLDPIGQANVMSRGIPGDIGGRLVVASPLYKQHFDLVSGICLEQPEYSLPVYPCRIQQDRVQLAPARSLKLVTRASDAGKSHAA